MPDAVDPEFAQDQGMLASEILKPQQVAFEIALIMKINVETGKVGICGSRYSVGG